jgi:SAM-dependent methyltransferase
VKRDGAYHPFLPHSLRRPFLEWVEAYVREQQITDPEVTEVVRAQLAPYRSRTVYAMSGVRQAVTGLRWTLRAALEDSARRVGRDIVPTGLHAWASRRVYGANYRPPQGLIDFGSLRRVTPISRGFGWDRGLPVDRYYIEQWLTQHAGDIRGRVLEIGDDDYTRRFGGDRVAQVDILHAYAGNPKATFIGDLSDAPQIPADTFDCVILTQTLHFVYDARAAIRTLHRILKPGGVVLITVPGISQIGGDEWREQWWWSFTSYSMTRMMRESFPSGQVSVHTYGNVLAAVALLHGAATHELIPAELDARDAEYQVIVAVRAVKPTDKPTASG